MKRFLLILIGLLILLPAHALAQDGGRGARMRSLADAAVSPAAQRTLERSADGIDAAWDGKDLEMILLFVDSAMATFLPGMEPDWAYLIDTGLRSANPQYTSASRSLGSVTACQRTDLFLLEEAMHEVRKNIDEAMTQRRVLTILALLDLHRFLDDRYSALSRLGSDPQGIDEDWNTERAFDGPDYKEGDEPVCPFTTDYLPPVVTDGTYGCDSATMEAVIEKLGTLPDQERVEALKTSIGLERDGIRGMENVLDESRETAKSIRDVQREIERLEGNGSPQGKEERSESGEKPAHREESGCLETLPDGVWLRAKTGPFSLSTDDTGILTAFRGMRRLEGSRRALPSFLRPKEGNETYETIGFRTEGLATLEKRSASQGEDEANTFGTAADPGLSMRESLKSFSLSVGTLAELATTVDGGVRGFVRDLAFFIERTCTGRPCAARLEGIRKIIYTDECFAFTNGQFLKDSRLNPRAKKCLEAAGLSELVPSAK